MRKGGKVIGFEVERVRKRTCQRVSGRETVLLIFVQGGMIMARKVTLFTGQWADLFLEVLAQKAKAWGYDGLELACWGDHFDVEQAAGVTLEELQAYLLKSSDLVDAAKLFATRECEPADKYNKAKWDLLAKYNQTCLAISNHLVGQAICDRIDPRHQGILPPKVWGNGVGVFPGEIGYDAVEAEAIRKRAALMMVIAGIAARRFMNLHPNQKAWGVEQAVVNGFTGSFIWPLLYSFPPVSGEMIEAGYADFAKRFIPILDAFKAIGVRFALEVHPTEIAFDIASAERALKAVNNHPAFGFNYDPSHFVYQGVDYVKFIRTFSGRIFHAHMKDAWKGHGDGTVGVFGGHIAFADPRRFWDFRSIGHGDVNFEEIIVALNDVGYQGPLSIEWEDSRMDREHGAAEAGQFIKKADFKPSDKAFDSAFEKK